jgi:hypothetical protein
MPVRLAHLLSAACLILTIPQPATAGTPTSVMRPTPNFFGAFTYENGLPVPISEGSVFAQGLALPPAITADRQTESTPPPPHPFPLCQATAPVVVGYRAPADGDALAVNWEFDEACRAVVTDISPADPAPCEDGSPPILPSEQAAPGQLVLDLVERNLFPGDRLPANHRMYVQYEARDLFGRRANCVSMDFKYTRASPEEGPRDIYFQDGPEEVCSEPPLGFFKLECHPEAGTFAALPLPDPHQGVDKAVWAAVTSEYGYPAFLIKYRMIVFAKDYMGDVVGSGHCEWDGTLPPGWKMDCPPPIIRDPLPV